MSKLNRGQGKVTLLPPWWLRATLRMQVNKRGLQPLSIVLAVPLFWLRNKKLVIKAVIKSWQTALGNSFKQLYPESWYVQTFKRSPQHGCCKPAKLQGNQNRNSHVLLLDCINKKSWLQMSKQCRTLPWRCAFPFWKPAGKGRICWLTISKSEEGHGSNMAATSICSVRSL